MSSTCKSDLSERCDALNAVMLDEANASRSGIYLSVVVYGKHGQHERVAGVAARKLARSKPIYFNVCPFCCVTLTGEPRVQEETHE